MGRKLPRTQKDGGEGEKQKVMFPQQNNLEEVLQRFFKKKKKEALVLGAAQQDTFWLSG